MSDYNGWAFPPLVNVFFIVVCSFGVWKGVELDSALVIGLNCAALTAHGVVLWLKLRGE